MWSIPSTTRPRLCTIWTAVAPDAVLTRRTNDPTQGGYPPRERVLSDHHPATMSANPLISAIRHHRVSPDRDQRYNSGRMLWMLAGRLTRDQSGGGKVRRYVHSRPVPPRGAAAQAGAGVREGSASRVSVLMPPCLLRGPPSCLTPHLYVRRQREGGASPEEAGGSS